MGLRIIIKDIDFSNNNIGNIFDVPIESVLISKVDGEGNYFTIVPTYIPSNTTETEFTYSIESGDATIDGNVVLYNSTGNVTVRCENKSNPNVYDIQTYSVTYNLRNIDFRDSLVKQILVDNFDTNNDGEISIDEAAVASSIRIDNAANSIFNGHNNEIEYFDEFKYFINTKTFRVLSTSLKRIELPPSITSVAAVAGTNFTSLESFVCNSNIGSIPNNYFLSSSIENIELWATSVGDNVFKNSAIKNVKFKEGLESIGTAAFNNTSTLSIDMPSTLTTVNGQFLRSTSMPKLIIRATTPPTWTSASTYGAPNDLAIYVPDASVDAYKAATGWSSVATKIHSLSDIEN